MFASIIEILADFKAGHMVILTDDENRENEGDLVMAAEAVTPAAVTFMVTHGRGLVCTPITRHRAMELDLHEMARPDDPFHTAFTVSVDGRRGVTTGISAQDRAKTIHLLASPKTKPADLVRPGHVFPLIAKDGGVPKLVIVTPSGTEALDRAAVAGISASNPFPPLPAEYRGNQLRLQLNFSYNLRGR